jgi:hypothetical protein
MNATPLRIVTAALLVLQLLISSPAAPTAQAALGTDGHGTSTFRIYLQATTATSGPYIDYEPASSVTTYTDPSATLASGTVISAGMATGATRQTFSFTTKTPLPRDYFLNLTQPFGGSVQFTTTPMNAGVPEHFKVRFELFQEGQRIGGSDTMSSYPTPNAGWFGRGIGSSSEVAKLEAGKHLTLKVTRIQGYTDLIIGTGGNRQSFIEFRYFETDPLQGALYLEEGELIKSAGSGPESQGDDAFFAAALPLLGLLALPATSRTGRKGLLVLLLLTMPIMAGCLGDDGNDLTTSAGNQTSGPGGQIETGSKENKTLQEKGLGALHGFVKDKDRFGVAVPDAHVSVLGTSLYTNSKTDGSYRFDNLTAKTYVVRVDIEGYESLEGSAKVEVGRVTFLNFSLVKPGSTPKPAGSNLKPHIHDDWGGETKLPWQDFTFFPTNWVGGLSFNAPNTLWSCSNTVVCSASVPIDTQKPVLPGATRVEVILDWAAGSPGTTTFELTLGAKPLPNGKGAKSFVARAPKDPYNIHFFPNEADPGHQKFTNWQFSIGIPTGSIYNFAGSPWWTGGPIRVQMWIHKGVVPFEPSHTDLWKGASQISLFEGVEKTPGTNMADYPREGDTSHWAVPDGKWVPPGTQKVTGTLSWTQTTSPAFTTQWTLAYKPASFAPSGWAFKDLPRVTVDQRSNNAIDFTIDLSTPEKAKETDQFYQRSTYWVFYIDDGGKEPYFYMSSSFAPTPNGDQGVKFTLSATAIKDPTYKET